MLRLLSNSKGRQRAALETAMRPVQCRHIRADTVPKQRQQYVTAEVGQEERRQVE